MPDPARVGRTSLQMLRAPTAAVYVWCNSMLDYPRAIARHVNRNDLQIVAPEWLDSAHGLRDAIIVDHSCRLNDRIALFVEIHNQFRYGG